MSIIEEEKKGGKRRKSGAYSDTTKGIATEVEESWGKKSGTCGQATRSAVKGVEEKPGIYFMIEGTGTLWEKHTWQGMSIRTGIVYKRGDSNICIV